MRHGRAKTARRTLKFYHLNGGITPPYKVLLDGNFIVESFRRKIPIRDRLNNILHTKKFTFYTTRSILDELDSLPASDDIISSARHFARSECRLIEPSDVPPPPETNGDDTTNDKSSPSSDLLRLLTPSNPQHYLLATQDASLSTTLRSHPNVPLLRINQTVLLLESISSASRSWAYRNESAKLTDISETERDLAAMLRRKRLREEREAMRRETRREAMEARRGVGRDKPKAKEPNPLSCKKKQVEVKGESKKKRRRRKKGTIEATG